MVQVNDERFITTAIERAVREEIARIIDEEVKAVQQRVEQRIAQVADRIALNVLRSYSVESHGGPELLIRVRKEIQP